MQSYTWNLYWGGLVDLSVEGSLLVTVLAPTDFVKLFHELSREYLIKELFVKPHQARVKVTWRWGDHLLSHKHIIKDPFVKHHLNNDPLIHDHLDKDPLIYDHLDKDPLVDVHFDKDPSVKKLSVEPLQARVKFAWSWSGRLLPSTPSKFTGIFYPL